MTSAKNRITKEDVSALSSQRRRVLACVPERWTDIVEVCKGMANSDGILFDKGTIGHICHGLAKQGFVEVRKRNRDLLVKKIPITEEPKMTVTPPKKVIKEVDILEALIIHMEELERVHTSSMNILMQAEDTIKKLREGDPELNEYKVKYLKLKELLS